MIFLDTNIVIDLLEPDPQWAFWSSQRLADAARIDMVIASSVVVAECAGRFQTLAQLRETFDALDIDIENISSEAMFAAGRAFREYRRVAKAREKILADFLIGAHAFLRGAMLITRDVQTYRTYFPDLTLITPETHP